MVCVISFNFNFFYGEKIKWDFFIFGEDEIGIKSWIVIFVLEKNFEDRIGFGVIKVDKLRFRYVFVVICV